jgi:hypothetical protein
MTDLPTEIINYCLFIADTGTKIIYNQPNKKFVLVFDFNHSKFQKLIRLLLDRTISYRFDSIFKLQTLVYLPEMFISELYSKRDTKSHFYNGVIVITEYDFTEPIIEWISYSIVCKKSRYCFFSYIRPITIVGRRPSEIGNSEHFFSSDYYRKRLVYLSFFPDFNKIISRVFGYPPSFILF